MRHNSSNEGVAIVSAVRTPIGAFQGSLAPLTAQQLGAHAIKAALARIRMDASAVQEVIFGNVLSANLGQAPARQAALGAGLPNSVCCTAVNKVCSSGLKAVAWAALQIQSGLADVIVAGGMESMTNTPYYLPGARAGLRMNNSTIVDGMVKILAHKLIELRKEHLQDGLWDPYDNKHMGECGELCATEHKLTRQDLDEHATHSIQRARTCHEEGITSWEIEPITVPGRRGKATTVSKDDGPWRKDPAKLVNEKGRFGGSGAVTAGNASPVSDGAAALVIMSAKKAKELQLPVLAWIRGMADAEREPERFTTAPALAIPKALKHANLRKEDVDYFEINEAFSAVSVANTRLLGLRPERVNAHGGAVAIGHPLGASGAVILVRLINVLRHNNARYGVAGICNGGGGASALVIECPPQQSAKL